jgi:hypothetical protein
MGLRILNAEGDTLEAAVKRGDGYWILKASVLDMDGDLGAGGYEFTTPVAGLSISPNSEVDIGVCRFNYPNGPGGALEETEYAFSVGAPLFQRMPPTGVQEGQTAQIDTGRQFQFSAIFPQLVPLPYFEVIVYFKQPSISPQVRRPQVEIPSAVVQFPLDQLTDTRVLQVYTFGRKTLKFGALFSTADVPAASGVLNVYQLSGLKYQSSPGLFTKTLLYSTPLMGATETGAGTSQQVEWEGEIRGADVIVVEAGGGAAIDVDAYFFVEARD